MPNATVRANAPPLPEATSRRALLGAVLAAGAVGAVAALPAAASAAPIISAVDRRVIDLWSRRNRLQAALHRLSDQQDALLEQIGDPPRPTPWELVSRFQKDMESLSTDDCRRKLTKALVALGSGLINQSQNAMAAAMQIAEK